MPHATDLDLTSRDVALLTSPDAIAAFFAKLGYETARRTTLSPEAIGLSGESAGAVKRIETLSEDPEQFLRVVFAQPKSLTAKLRNDLVRVLGRGTLDHLLVLASDFDTLEFVLLDKRKRERRGPAGSAGRPASQAAERIQVVPKTFSVNRRVPSRLDLRMLRRFTWTCRDALDQFDKLRGVFDAAAYTGEYFQNRGLFSDHYLRERLREAPSWRESPAELFAYVRDALRDAQRRWATKDETTLRTELLEPLFARLGFEAVVHRPGKTDQPQPDYLLLPSPSGRGAGGEGDRPLTAAFVYAWDRWLDGPDLNDADTPDENPGACVVSALEAGIADWILVTNGRFWRLYSRQAHARATNFYEVDLVEALTDSGDTDPNEAFRYWSLFFRPTAFLRSPSGRGAGGEGAGGEGGTPEGAICWLDAILFGSRDYAKRLGERLKERVFVSIFPHLAQGFLTDRRQRLGLKSEPTDQELADVFEATLTLLYRLLFLLYAESRDLLPIREAPYHAASLKKIKEEIADRAGVAESDLDARLQQAYSPEQTALYDRLCRLFRAMDQGDPVLNVPTYNGGLFQTPAPHPGPLPKGEAKSAEPREHHIARFLLEHKVPDRFLALAIDRLARDQDERTLGLVFIDYKSLEVRHLGSIYEGLLEFQLRVADEDLTTQTDKKGEKYIPLGNAKPRRGRSPSPSGRGARGEGGEARVRVPVVVARGEVYLSNDKAQRKASGSYYTPDPIVKYIVEQAVGPVLAERLEALRGDFRQVRKTFDRELQKARAFPGQTPAGASKPPDPRELAAENTYAACRGLVERLFEFRVLDPAMGSGHFLVEAVDFITDRLLTFLNQFPINPVTFMLARTRRNILEALAEQGVSVDPAKLTDVNLLKRHVLKRCIYGVDLNPMAVELAKLSLWLDAFTLGAPLSFLDHHLRCGNSLIGATFADLQAATRGKLFGIDYEPLLRAIRHVLHVNKVADATAAEVKQSASEYDHARRELSGYQIVLDLLVARHFGFPKAPGLMEHGDNLKLDSRADFMASLDDLGELALVERVEALARQPDRRFFHWEIEFPEVFFAFADVQERHLKHKNDLAEGSAGFDAVVGNPPYVRQETIKPFKDFLKTSYETFDSTNDLYVYFQEQEIRHLRAGGRMGMIVANKWMRAGYGERLRGYLMQTACPQEVVDFGHSPIFPDADTFPCILIVSRRPGGSATQDGEAMATCQVPRENWNDRMDLGAFVGRGRYSIPTRLLRAEGWSLENPAVQALLEKIRRTGVPLKEFCGSSPLYGIKTGFNEAFFIDEPTRSRLIAEDKKSAEVIKPLLRGRDIDRWRPRRSGMYLIFARRGIEIDRYPAIKRHLAQYRQQLEPRPADWQGTTDDWPGRAPGDYKWYELQASLGDEFARALESRKLLYQEIQFHSWYCLETEGAAINNKVFMLASDDPALLGVLCSPLMWWQLTRVLPHMKDEALNPAGFVMEHVCVCLGAEPVASDIRKTVNALLDETTSLHAWEDEVFGGMRDGLDIAEPDDRIFTWLALPSDTFLARLAKLAELRRPSAAWESEASRFQQEARSLQVGLLARQLELEKRLALLVEDAYGLTAAERALLRSTRPIRDPLDVLEAKIRGTGETAVETGRPA